jgi:hypothetical protein
MEQEAEEAIDKRIIANALSDNLLPEAARAGRNAGGAPKFVSNQNAALCLHSD